MLRVGLLCDVCIVLIFNLFKEGTTKSLSYWHSMKLGILFRDAAFLSGQMNLNTH